MLRSAVFVPFMLLPLFLSGCSETQVEAEHEHEHHHDHGPRPTFEGVVKRVRKQYRWAVQAASRDDVKHFQHELEHFHESVDLLPELAAETDLHKADWDRVNAASKVLAAECARIGQTKAQPSEAVQAAFDVAVKELEEIASKLPPRRNESK